MLDIAFPIVIHWIKVLFFEKQENDAVTHNWPNDIGGSKHRLPDKLLLCVVTDYDLFWMITANYKDCKGCNKGGNK